MELTIVHVFFLLHGRLNPWILISFISDLMLIYSKQNLNWKWESVCSENHANDGLDDLDSSLSLTSFPTYPNLDFEFLKKNGSINIVLGHNFFNFLWFFDVSGQWELGQGYNCYQFFDIKHSWEKASELCKR